jgi:peptidylprolyl isomerase/peptidyl-prolyl cis-trans isomerase B (cyclophilin B)
MAWLLVAAVLAGCAGSGAKPGASAEAPVTAAPAFPAPAGVPVVVVRTERGTFKFALLEKIAPKTVQNFVALAEKGFYNNLAFHRVEPGILIQGGDPQGNGTGGPGYSIKAEFNDHPHLEGTVAMARRSDPDSAGSQWYVCLQALPQLDRQYTVFGQCFEGLDVLRAIRKGDRMLEVRIDYADPAALPADALR